VLLAPVVVSTPARHLDESLTVPTAAPTVTGTQEASSYESPNCCWHLFPLKTLAQHHHDALVHQFDQKLVVQPLCVLSFEFI